jgi:hypothetical protein
MQFSRSIFATLLLAASARATGLIRGTAKSEAKLEGLTEAEFGSATVILSHVSTPGKWSNKIVSDAFKQAYNDVHTGAGVPYIDWTFVDTQVQVPEDGSSVPGSQYWESNNWCRFKYICPNCSPGTSLSHSFLPGVLL